MTKKIQLSDKKYGIRIFKNDTPCQVVIIITINISIINYLMENLNKMTTIILSDIVYDKLINAMLIVDNSFNKYINIYNINAHSTYLHFIVQWEQNGGQCGICGDPYHLEEPRPHEAGGLYGKGIIGRHYSVGQVTYIDDYFIILSKWAVSRRVTIGIAETSGLFHT